MSDSIIKPDPHAHVGGFVVQVKFFQDAKGRQVIQNEIAFGERSEDFVEFCGKTVQKVRGPGGEFFPQEFIFPMVKVKTLDQAYREFDTHLNSFLAMVMMRKGIS